MTLSRREKVLLVILAFMIVFYFYYTQIYLRQVEIIKALNMERTQLMYNPNTNGVLIENIEQVLQIEKDLLSEQGILFTDEQYKIVNMLNTIFSDTQVSLISMDFALVENVNDIVVMRSICLINGDKQNINLFIETLENIKYKSKIFSCDIENNEEGGIRCSITLDFFMI